MKHELDNQPVPIIKKNIDIINNGVIELKLIAKAMQKQQNKIYAAKREIAILRKQRNKIWEKTKL